MPLTGLGREFAKERKVRVRVCIRRVSFCSRTAPTASPHCNTCAASAAAATSAWPTDVARNLPPFTPTSEPEDSANLPATDAAKVDTHAKKRRRPSDDASSAAVQQSPRLEELARASGGLSAGLAHPSVAADSLGLAKRARWCQPGNNTWEAAGDRLPSKAWHQPVRCTSIDTSDAEI